jgi:hypothetical protein
MTTDLPAAELDFYRESRAIDPASSEWGHMLGWYRESHPPVLDCARMDAELARFRGDQ